MSQDEIYILETLGRIKDEILQEATSKRRFRILLKKYIGNFAKEQKSDT